MGIFAHLGALKVSVSVTVLTFLSGYQKFTFDKSLMKRLYFEEKESYQSGHEERSNEVEFKYRIENRKQYSFGYCGYICTMLA